MRRKDEGESAPNMLGNDDRPLFFRVADPISDLPPPGDVDGVSLRTWARSLAGMQKEAIVLNGSTGQAWRLASDEGPYLHGYDAAPCPLSFLTTGMAASYMNAIGQSAQERGVSTSGLRLTLDNFYTMDGSALRGTMTGGALAPHLTVEIESDTPEIRALVADAVNQAPITALLNDVHESLFGLAVNGQPEPVGRVAALSDEPPPDPEEALDITTPSDDGYSDLIYRLTPAAEVAGVPGGKDSSLQESQSRRLHVRGVCTVREDGVKEIVQNLYEPIGSEFRFLSDEAPGLGGQGRAPDAATYMSAGIAFCFMTQFGRYAKIVKRNLDAYRIVQNTRFSSHGHPVETHVYLDTDEGADFARTVLDMSEQTCCLHAFCRTDLDLQLEVKTR